MLNVLDIGFVSPLLNLAPRPYQAGKVPFRRHMLMLFHKSWFFGQDLYVLYALTKMRLSKNLIFRNKHDNHKPMSSSNKEKILNVATCERGPECLLSMSPSDL